MNEACREAAFPGARMDRKDIIGISLIAGIFAAIAALFLSTWWQIAALFIVCWATVFFVDRLTWGR